MSAFTTPLAVDPYSRYMVEVFDDREVISVPTAFQTFFGRPAAGGKTLFSPNANIVEIDIIRGNERLAALIHRGTNARMISGQQNTQEQKFTSVSRVYPLIEEEGGIEADQLNRRLAGENPYANMDKLDRLRELARIQHQEHVRRMLRLYEYLASQSILTGEMPGILGTTNSDLIYDFYRPATHTITPATKWDVVTSDILGDIDTGCALIRADAHVTPDMLIMGGGSMEALLANTAVQTLADNRRFELIDVATNNPVPPNLMPFVDAGLIPRGRLRTPQGYTVWLFTYVDVYTNSAGTATLYMPTNQALLAYSGARCDRYFGPSEVLPMTPTRAAMYQEMFGFSPSLQPMPPRVKNQGHTVRPEMFYFDAYMSTNHKNVTIRSQSAPIFATTMTDAFVTFTATLTP